jgi:hypothetical protein
MERVLMKLTSLSVFLYLFRYVALFPPPAHLPVFNIFHNSPRLKKILAGVSTSLYSCNLLHHKSQGPIFSGYWQEKRAIEREKELQRNATEERVRIGEQKSTSRRR